MPQRIPTHRPLRLRSSRPQRDESGRPNAAARGYCDKAHKRWRQAVLTRCNWACVDCGRVAHGRQLHADHIVPISQGGERYDVANGVLDILSGMNRQQDQLLGGLSGLYGQRNTDFGTGMNNVVGAQQGILDDWLRRSGLIGQGYDALNQRVMDRTDLMGYQRANEINDAFTRQGAQADQDLINRGLSNTTIRPSVMRGVENDRERALTGLREDVNNQLNQYDMGTTNPALQFGERSAQYASGLGGNVAGTMQQGLQGLAGLQGEGLQFGERANQYQQQLGNNVVNWIGNRNDVGPDFNTLAQLALGVGASGFGYGAMPSLPAGSPGFPTGVPSPSLPYYQSPPQQSNQPPSRAGGTAYTPGITGGPSQMRPLSNTKPYATLF